MRQPQLRLVRGSLEHGQGLPQRTHRLAFCSHLPCPCRDEYMAHNFSDVPGVDWWRERPARCATALLVAAASAALLVRRAFRCLPPLLPLPCLHVVSAPDTPAHSAAYPQSNSLPAVVPFNSALDARATGYLGSMSRYLRTWLALQAGPALPRHRVSASGRCVAAAPLTTACPAPLPRRAELLRLPLAQRRRHVEPRHCQRQHRPPAAHLRGTQGGGLGPGPGPCEAMRCWSVFCLSLRQSRAWPAAPSMQRAENLLGAIVVPLNQLAGSEAYATQLSMLRSPTEGGWVGGAVAAGSGCGQRQQMAQGHMCAELCHRDSQPFRCAPSPPPFA